MPILINLRKLEDDSLDLEGTVSIAELELENLDEVVHLDAPAAYRLTATRLEDAVLIEGSYTLPLTCDCVRCLKNFPVPLEVSDWTLHLPLSGEDKVTVVNESVDLTPYLREDILLAVPRHPLCEPGCPGLPQKVSGIGKQPSGSNQTLKKVSAWDELNKLKL